MAGKTKSKNRTKTSKYVEAFLVVVVALILMGIRNSLPPWCSFVFEWCSLLIIAVFLAAELHVSKQSMSDIGIGIPQNKLAFVIKSFFWFSLLVLWIAIFIPFGIKILNDRTPAVIVSFLIGAIFEEIVFRGFMLRRLLKLYDNLPFAVILTSLLFGMIHVGPSQPLNFIYILIISVIYGLSYVDTNSLIAPILIHLIINVLLH